jgi:hypothetical protein
MLKYEKAEMADKCAQAEETAYQRMSHMFSQVIYNEFNFGLD